MPRKSKRVGTFLLTVGQAGVECDSGKSKPLMVNGKACFGGRWAESRRQGKLANLALNDAGQIVHPRGFLPPNGGKPWLADPPYASHFAVQPSRSTSFIPCLLLFCLTLVVHFLILTYRRFLPIVLISSSTSIHIH